MRKSLCRVDAGLRPIRDAKDLAIFVGQDTSFGWPLWWRQYIVLEYCHRLDGVHFVDAIGTDLPPFRLSQHSRKAAIERVKSSTLSYAHVGDSLPTQHEWGGKSLAHLPYGFCSEHRFYKVWSPLCAHPTGFAWRHTLDCRHRLWLPPCSRMRLSQGAFTGPTQQRRYASFSPPMVK